jgi:PAS domain S-box-containing protein
LAYLLNQQGRYTLAAGLTITVTALGVWAAVLTNRDSLAANPLLMLYVLLSVLLSSLLLSPRATALVAAVHLLGLLLAPALISGLGASVVVDSIVFVSFISLITVVGASLRQRDQAQLLEQTRALGESGQRFRLLFSASPDAVLLIDPHNPQVDWPILDCNEAACRMNGYAREELPGESVDILNTSPGTPQERLAYSERLRREQGLHLAAFHRHKNGRLFPIEVSTSLIILAGHELVLGIDRDITERKTAEQALRQSEEQFHLVSHATNDAVWDWDVLTNQVWWNIGVQRLFGYGAEQVGPDIGWWEDQIHPDDRGQAVASIHGTLDSGEEFWSQEYRYRRADGAYAQVLDRGYVLGQPLGTITVSLGVAVYPDHGATGEAVVRAADTALYRAKREGRDRAVAAQAGDGPAQSQ